MANQIVTDALEKIADGWHALTGAAETLAPELSPLAAKVMQLAAAGNPLLAASETALMELVDVFKAAEAHRSETAPPPAPATLPIEGQAAAAVAAAAAPGATETAPPVVAGDQVVNAA